MTETEKLYRYADRYARRSERDGRGTRYPTVREAAKRLRVPQSAIEGIVDEYQGDGYMGLASYFCNPPQPMAEHVVEAYGDSLLK